jgi:acetylornithine deacetylase/succinyl-diaminopimelate desuccinylase-like protein
LLWKDLMVMDKTFAYIEDNKERFLEELQEFLRFPSVSAQSAHKQDLIDCAGWLKQHLEGLGLEAELVETRGQPIVRARGGGQSDRKVIIYGHYDVQPEDPVDQWHTPPFEPVLKDGFIYGRGTTDDKGQLFAHIKAVESLLKTQEHLRCEVLFLVEGEEESSGESLADYIKEQKADLAENAIGVVVSDSGMYDENTPAITYGLRGVLALEVTIKGPVRDVHSGVFGGAIGNPVTVLCHIMAQCIGADGRIRIPGFYDEVRELKDWERQNITKLAYDDNELLRELKIGKIFGEEGFTTLERIWARPTFEINGIYGGYTGEGGKTIIPASATAKISMRLVPRQDPARISALTTEYIRAICPDYVALEISEPHGAKPVLFDVNDPLIKAGGEALQAGFGQEAVYIGCGGSIPVVNTFWEQLRKPIVLMGLGLDSDGAHSPNERFKIDNFINGAKASAYLLNNSN